MIPFVTAAVVLGLSSGFSPGPLLTLVIAQTVTHGVKEGIKVALAPLITDAVIITVAVSVLSRFAHIHTVLGWISICGGLFVIYLAWETFRAPEPRVDLAPKQARSLGRGIAVNALNPHPYIFWIAVGAPMMVRAREDSLVSAVAFVLCFFVSLVGAKVLVAVLVGRTKKVLTGRIYRWIMRFLGLALFLFALFLVRDGLVLLTVIAKFP
ncbi:MAG TPA: LysE family translocator [Syntrophorhabdaceae bacterium]|nr:LysE family translocator [Syntrophorhabdaceae bacterium]